MHNDFPFVITELCYIENANQKSKKLTKQTVMNIKKYVILRQNKYMTKQDYTESNILLLI